MKNLIIAFALIVAVTCDVSHVVQGDGWYKDETGYHYIQPAAKYDAVEEQVVEVGAFTPYGEPEVQDEVVEVLQEIAPAAKEDELREYLPPKQDEFKRKRQIPVRRNKVVRRFVRRH
ncbi:uncharacterized protein [Chironomus tepperi]|uniref:uncharacterized protein n=1 Tax=Chironomus tepperi TaxID=113505 RepID=UPI00391F1389